MTEIINIIDVADDGRKQARDPQDIWGAMVHRCGVDLQTGVVLGYHAAAVSDAFCGRAPEWAEVAKATGGQNAYSFLIGGDLGPSEFDGVCWQCLPIDEIGWHGRRFSEGFLGIGLIADPREKAVSQRQYVTLVDLLAELCTAFGWDPMQRIKGHGEVKGSHDGSKAPGKPAACPGDLLDMYRLRSDADAIMREKGLRRLSESGFVFTRGQ